ncbi:hypothetical protein BDR05DRAFT_947901 [Suillus weaverae]|nr:hypothetical protein BDR05DRAFT_947901 [Suillus weaverae]
MALQQLPGSHQQKIEAMTLGQSSATSMFWTLDQMNQIGAHLATIGHHQFLNHHNQPEAHLIRSHVVREKSRRCKLLVFMGNAAAMVLRMPIMVDCIKSTSVDGVMNGVEVNSFINDFSTQAKGQITLAGVSMAMDIAILAIPGLGLMKTSQILCSCSILLGIPTSFCVLSVMGSILGFLSGVATDLKPSVPLMISSLATLGVVVVMAQGQPGCGPSNIPV